MSDSLVIIAFALLAVLSTCVATVLVINGEVTVGLIWVLAALVNLAAAAYGISKSAD